MRTSEIENTVVSTATAISQAATSPVPAAGQHDDSRSAFHAEPRECIGQQADDGVIDGVAHVRPVDSDGRDAARVLGDENRSFAHLTSLRIEVLLEEFSDCTISFSPKTD